jgi:hypothetical protein
MQNNLTTFVNEQINKVVNVNDIKELNNTIKKSSVQTFENSVILAQKVAKLKETLKDSTFKQVAKDSYNLTYTNVYDLITTLTGFSKAWASRLSYVGENTTNEKIKDYKKLETDKATDKGRTPSFSIDGYDKFLRPTKETTETAEKTELEKIIEKASKLEKVDLKTLIQKLQELV